MLGLLTANKQDIPAVDQPLYKDIEGKEVTTSWKYRSTIGVLNYLAGSTQPDIAYATHQCACFSSAPKSFHVTAVKRISRYILGRKDRGLIIKPDNLEGIKCYVDANFVGAWHKLHGDDPSNVLSQTGYVTQFKGCPIFFT